MSIRNACYLRSQAVKCRELAAMCDDAVARHNLLYLASEYEVEAGELERRASDQARALAYAC
jgi:hypothetical protein